MKTNFNRVFRTAFVFMLVLTTAFTSILMVWAEDTAQGQTTPQITPQEQSDPQDPPQDPSEPEDPPIEIIVPQVTGVKTLRGYNRVTLRWNKVNAPLDAPSGSIITYNIYRNGSETPIASNLAGTSYVDKTAKESIKYKYTIAAVLTNTSLETPVIGANSSAIEGETIRPMYIIGYTKKKDVKYYDKPKSKKASGKIKLKNTKIVAYGGHNGGRELYRFVAKINGRNRYISTSDFKNIKYEYNRKNNVLVSANGDKWDKGTWKGDYTPEEKEAYVNDRKLTSKTKYLIWVSTYQQKVNVFEKKGGKWKLKYVWVTNTGRAAAPTPYGAHYLSGVHYDVRHDLKYWSAFCGVAFHSRREMTHAGHGRPASKGCCRLSASEAKWVYNKCKKGTMVIVF